MNTVIALQESREPQAAHHVLEQLREMILSIALPPGAPLSRAELQRKFHVSSTPVRDALMRLEEVGLVDVIPQSGTMVSLIDVPQARQAQFLRHAIELEAVRKVASAPTADTVRKLRDVLVEQRERAKANDLKGFNRADLVFHKILYDAADVPDLWALVRRERWGNRPAACG